MGGYKSTGVASTTWCRVKRHLQKIAPVADPNLPEDTDDKKRKLDEDGDEEEGPATKRGKISKAVGPDDELASEVVKVGTSAEGKNGKRKESPTAKNELTPEEDSQDGPLNCITVKGSDADDGPASRKKTKTTRGGGPKAGKSIGERRKNKMNATAVYNTLMNGVGGSGGATDADSGTKKGESVESSGGASCGNGKDPQESIASDDDTIIAKVGADLDSGKADESRENAGSIEAAPAEASKANKGKNAKGAKGNGSTSKKVKGKLATDSDSVEAASVKKASQVKTTNTKATGATKTTTGDARAKKENKLSVKYIIDDSPDSDVVPDSQESEKA